MVAGVLGAVRGNREVRLALIYLKRALTLASHSAIPLSHGQCVASRRLATAAMHAVLHCVRVAKRSMHHRYMCVMFNTDSVIEGPGARLRQCIRATHREYS